MIVWGLTSIMHPMTYDRPGKPVEGTLEILSVIIFKTVAFEASISVLRWTWGSKPGPK